MKLKMHGKEWMACWCNWEKCATIHIYCRAPTPLNWTPTDPCPVPTNPLWRRLLKWFCWTDCWKGKRVLWLVVLLMGFCFCFCLFMFFGIGLFGFCLADVTEHITSCFCCWWWWSFLPLRRDNNYTDCLKTTTVSCCSVNSPACWTFLKII